MAYSGVFARPQLLVWPQFEPVAVVAWGLGRTYSGGPYSRNGVVISDPGDLELYSIRVEMPQAVRQHSILLELPIDPADDRSGGLRGLTGLHPDVQRHVFNQRRCREVCHRLLRTPSHIVLPEPLRELCFWS